MTFTVIVYAERQDNDAKFILDLIKQMRSEIYKQAIQRIIDSHMTYYDGSGYRGLLKDDGREAQNAFEAVLTAPVQSVMIPTSDPVIEE
jgi:hypothetical protein